jgi:hypothetical protein
MLPDTKSELARARAELQSIAAEHPTYVLMAIAERQIRLGVIAALVLMENSRTV